MKQGMNGRFISISLSQQLIGFTQSRKLCLNLCSRRWLKPNLNLVIGFIPIELWQLKFLLGVGRMNCKLPFLKRAEFSALLILLSTLLHSITVDGKNEFLKKVCLALKRGILSILFHVLYTVLLVGTLSNRMLGGLIFSYLKEIAKFSKPATLL